MMMQFEDMPNELCLKIFSYLNTPDLFRSFSNLNIRFDGLLYTSTEQVQLPENTQFPWLVQLIPQIESNIQKIFLSEKYLRFIFQKQWSFSKLRYIQIQRKEWTMGLKFLNEPYLNVLLQSLNVLRSSNLAVKNFIPHLEINTNEISAYKPSYVLCPFIKYLSLNGCTETALHGILRCTPMLTRLKLSYTTFDNSVHWSDINLTLVDLDIRRVNTCDLRFVSQIIHGCQASLKKCRIEMSSLEKIHGNCIDQIFGSCTSLRQFEFCFEYHSSNELKKANFDTLKNEWRLNWYHFNIYIQFNILTSNIVVVSMPCRYPFQFQNNLCGWCIANSDQHSSSLRFTNTNQIHLTNTMKQLISLEYLMSLNEIFTSPNQTLQFNYCGLDGVETLLYMFMEDRSISPVLPRVREFVVSSGQNVGPIVLCVWILLMPNLQVLNLTKLNTDTQAGLIQELLINIDDNKQLRSIFESVPKMVLLKRSDDKSPTPIGLIAQFKSVFVHADVR
ncbi:unnamed protein product [Adineta ricciae]|uniref:F-box domain-containing protein n=1 Tax=Adineta ricciae TaxID=249248 RepID=A0A814I7U6_ADIRI|nr:unnamed protein product [Adineta ricciae]CAF1019888.1 unnamed protein product [Adineta ricciae]